MEKIILSAAIQAALKTLSSLATSTAKIEGKLETQWLKFGETAREAFVTEANMRQHDDAIQAAIFSGVVAKLSAADRKLAEAEKASVRGNEKAAKVRTAVSNTVSSYKTRVYKYAFPKAKGEAAVDPAIEAARKAAAQAAVEKTDAMRAEVQARNEVGALKLKAKLAEMAFKQAPEAGKTAAKSALTKAKAALTKAEKAEEKAKAEAEAKAEEAKAAKAEAEAKAEEAKAAKAKAELKAKLEAALKLAQETSVEGVAGICNALRDLIAKI